MRTLRTLRQEPRWLAGLAVAVVFALACVWLAQWQLDRRVARAERNAAVLENYDAEPVPLADLLGEDTDVGQAIQWRPVRARGTYLADEAVLVRNRPQQGSNGYLVAVPFRLAPPADPASVWVVRGWLPSGSEASRPEFLPEPPAGQVELVGRVRSAEPAGDRDAPPGQTFRLDEQLLGSAGVDVGSAYLVLAEEQPAGDDGLAPVPRPDTDPGPHLAYGVQWYMFAVAGFVLWGVLVHRRANAEEQDGPAPADRVWTYSPGGPTR